MVTTSSVNTGFLSTITSNGKFCTFSGSPCSVIMRYTSPDRKYVSPSEGLYEAQPHMAELTISENTDRANNFFILKILIDKCAVHIYYCYLRINYNIYCKSLFWTRDNIITPPIIVPLPRKFELLQFYYNYVIFAIVFWVYMLLLTKCQYQTCIDKFLHRWTCLKHKKISIIPQNNFHNT